MDLNQNESQTKISKRIVGSLTGELVKITINSGFELSVHRNLLLSHAPWFKKAFAGNFWEAETGHINLRDTEIEDQHTIEMFVSWLYGFKYLDKEGPSQSWLQISKLWVFADKIHVIGLQNKAMRILLTKWRLHGSNISVNTLNWIWEHTTPDSKLRQFFLDVSLSMDIANAQASAEDMHVELLQQIFVSARETIDYDAPSISQLKYYVRQIDPKPLKKEIPDADLGRMLMGKTWRLRSKQAPSEIELKLEGCWQSTERLFNAIQALKECQVLKKWDEEIYEIQEVDTFVPQGVEIEGLLAETDNGTLRIKRNDDNKLREAVSSLACSPKLSANVEVIISYA